MFSFRIVTNHESKLKTHVNEQRVLFYYGYYPWKVFNLIKECWRLSGCILGENWVEIYGWFNANAAHCTLNISRWLHFIPYRQFSVSIDKHFRWLCNNVECNCLRSKIEQNDEVFIYFFSRRFLHFDPFVQYLAYRY